jgi:hypothetical protein
VALADHRGRRGGRHRGGGGLAAVGLARLAEGQPDRVPRRGHHQAADPDGDRHGTEYGRQPADGDVPADRVQPGHAAGRDDERHPDVVRDGDANLDVDADRDRDADHVGDPDHVSDPDPDGDDSDDPPDHGADNGPDHGGALGRGELEPRAAASPREGGRSPY